MSEPATGRGKVQGKVVTEVIIRRDGTVGAVRVVRSLDPGLDLKAIDAVRQWLFVPGKFQGPAGGHPG
jgi:TonB family protein